MVELLKKVIVLDMIYPYVNIHTHFAVEEGEVTISAVGVHPWSAERCSLAGEAGLVTKKELEGAIASVDAIGEIGLDFAAEVDREAQKSLFVAQLKLAKKHKKPVVLHCVKAFEPTMELLKTFHLPAVIFHGFIGSVQQMNQAVERGYYVSFGERTFASPKSLKALREAPLERLFFETDMSEEDSIEDIFERASKYRMESVDELKKATYESYKYIFPDK